MKASESWFRSLTFFLLSIAVGAQFVAIYIGDTRIASLQKQLEASQKSERTAWGKVYDLQENHDDRCFSEEATMHLKLFEAEKALGECQAKVKP